MKKRYDGGILADAATKSRGGSVISIGKRWRAAGRGDFEPRALGMPRAGVLPPRQFAPGWLRGCAAARPGEPPAAASGRTARAPLQDGGVASPGERPELERRGPGCRRYGARGRSGYRGRWVNPARVGDLRQFCAGYRAPLCSWLCVPLLPRKAQDGAPAAVRRQCWRSQPPRSGAASVASGALAPRLKLDVLKPECSLAFFLPVKRFVGFCERQDFAQFDLLGTPFEA